MAQKEYRKKEMRSALAGFYDAYVTLRDEWLRYDGFELNETESIKLYPFNKSFDELEVVAWVEATLDELTRPIEELEPMYSPGSDITFVMNNVYNADGLASQECVGWYHGEPNPTLTKLYAKRKMKATY